MIIKILEFKLSRGNHVKVQSHNKRKGKWKKNPNFKWYQSMVGSNPLVIWKKEYTKEFKDE